MKNTGLVINSEVYQIRKRYRRGRVRLIVVFYY